MSSPSLPLRFICLWRSRSKEGKKRRPEKHLCLFEEQEIQSETEEEQQNLKPKEDPKNLITIETIYQSLLTWRNYTKTTWKTKQTLESNCSLLKLENLKSKPLEKTKTNQIFKKQTTSTVYLELSMSAKTKTKSVVRNKKETRSKKKGKKYEVQLTRKPLENYKRKV